MEGEIINHRKWNSVLDCFGDVIYVIIQTQTSNTSETFCIVLWPLSRYILKCNGKTVP
jgi:hypothetical protein